MDLFNDLIPLPSVEQIAKLVDDTSHYTNEMLHSIFAGWIGANAAVKSKTRGGFDRSPLGPFQCGPGVCIRMAGISGGVAVAMNAYGAHFVISNPDINEERKRAMLYAINHHFVNTIGMALAGVGAHYPAVTASLFALSSLLFCMPSYMFAVRNDRRLRALSPYGGVMAMLAWFSFIL